MLNNYSKLLYVFCILFMLSPPLLAQSGVVVSGGDVSSENGSIAFSIGQVFQSSSQPESSIFEGVQHAYEINGTLTNTEYGIQYVFKTFPNPAGDYLYIIKPADLTNTSFTLSDMSGRILKQRSLDSVESRITLNQLPSAIYFLSIYHNSNLLQTIKISKK